jgi:hypothetical protein
MRLRRLGWCWIALLWVLAGCDVQIGKCKRDAGECEVRFDEEDAGGDGDSGADGMDAGPGQIEAGALDGGYDAGEQSADAGDGLGPRLTLEEFCRAYQARRLQWADKIEECCDGDPGAHSSEADQILNLFGADDGAGLCVTKHQALIDGGSLEFHGDKAQACADAFVAQFAAPPETCPAGGFDSVGLRATVAHGSQLLQQLPACRAALEGKVAADQPCTDSIQCAGGRRCRAAPGGGTTCQAAVPGGGGGGPLTGGSCATNSECADGTICIGDRSTAGGRVCRPVSMLGNDTEHCSFSRECVVGSICSVEGTSGGVCQTAPAGTSDDVCAP